MDGRLDACVVHMDDARRGGRCRCTDGMGFVDGDRGSSHRRLTLVGARVLSSSTSGWGLRHLARLRAGARSKESGHTTVREGDRITRRLVESSYPPRYAGRPMSLDELKTLRARLEVSRTDLARFLGVSETTIVRWESDDAISEPRGLQAVLLRALLDAMANHPPRDIARIVRSCGVDHRLALRRLLDAAG